MLSDFSFHWLNYKHLGNHCMTTAITVRYSTSVIQVHIHSEAFEKRLGFKNFSFGLQIVQNNWNAKMGKRKPKPVSNVAMSFYITCA